MEVLRNVSEATIDAEYASFLDELNRQAHTPPNDDPIASAQCTALYEAHQTLPAIEGLTRQFLATEPVVHAPYRVRKMSSGMQYFAMAERVRIDVGYPERFIDPMVCLEFVRDRFGDTRIPDHAALRHVLRTRPLQTSRSRRSEAVSFLLGMQKLRGALDYSDTMPVVHDYGSADNLVLKALVHPVRNLEHATAVGADGTKDPDATAFFDLVVNMAPFGKGYGIEAHPPRTQVDKDWLKACALDPSELATAQGASPNEERYDLLAVSCPSQVKPIKADFLHLPERQKLNLERNKADVAFLSHVVPHDTNGYRRIFEAIRPFVKKTGIIAVHGYVKVEPREPQGVRLVDDWYAQKWLCQTVVLSADKPADEAVPVLQWETSRCEKVRLLEGIGKFLPKVVDLFDR